MRRKLDSSSRSSALSANNWELNGILFRKFLSRLLLLRARDRPVVGLFEEMASPGDIRRGCCLSRSKALKSKAKSRFIVFTLLFYSGLLNYAISHKKGERLVFARKTKDQLWNESELRGFLISEAFVIKNVQQGSPSRNKLTFLHFRCELHKLNLKSIVYLSLIEIIVRKFVSNLASLKFRDLMFHQRKTYRRQT